MRAMDRLWDKMGDKRTWFGLVIVIGLIAFDIFNFATTQNALNSFSLGSLWGIRMSIALAVAFCAIDLAGLASLFTHEKGMDEPWWVWMFGAGWLVASAVNAIGTWWAILLGMQDAPAINNPMFTAQQLYYFVPVILALTVWLIRLLLIGSTILAWDNEQPERPRSRPVMKSVSSGSAPASQRPPIQKPLPASPRPQGAIAITSPFGPGEQP
jgi:hypothetical protein